MSREVSRPAAHGSVQDTAGVRPETRQSLRNTKVRTTPEETKRSYSTALRYWETWHRLRYASELEWPVSKARILDFICDHLACMAEPGSDLVIRTDDQDADDQPKTTRGLVARWNLPIEVDRAMVACGVKAALGPLAIRTVRHRIHALATAHRLRGIPGQTRSDEVREALRIYARAQFAVADQINNARGAAAPKRKDGAMSALTRDKLLKLIYAEKGDAFADCRDRAILLVGWAAGGRRRSEVATLRCEQLRLSDDGTYYSWTLGKTKTNQDGNEERSKPKPITGSAAEALREWLELSGIRSGPVFRRIRAARKNREMLTPSEELQRQRDRVGENAISANAIYELVRARAKRAGLTTDETAAWGAHSLRNGYITQAARDKVPMAETMAMTDHKSIQMLVHYYDKETLPDSAAANLLDLRPTKQTK